MMRMVMMDTGSLPSEFRRCPLLDVLARPSIPRNPASETRTFDEGLGARE
jgi:hypothetical protein